jgi:hypothetical protein
MLARRSFVAWLKNQIKEEIVREAFITASAIQLGFREP